MNTHQKHHQKNSQKTPTRVRKFTWMGVAATSIVVGAGALIWAHQPVHFIRPAQAEDAQPEGTTGSHAHKAAPPTNPAQVSATKDAPKFVTKYTCPMHPQIIEDHPGTCPICGMDLVAKQFPAKTSAQNTVPVNASEAQDRAAQTLKPASSNHANEASTSSHPSPTAEKPSSGPKFVTKYTCPMHPQIIEDHPGHCPICGMTLVPKLFPAGTKDNTGGSPTSQAAPSATATSSKASAPMPEVAIAPRTLRDMNVVLAQTQWRNLTREIHSVGLVALDENLIAHVHPRASGWVETLNARALGDTVKKGQVLLTVYSPDILSAEKDFLVAQKSGMREMREAARERLRLLNVPDSVIDQIARTGKVARTIPVLAPQSGYISAINLRDGMYVTPDLDMFTIADDRKIWVQVEVLPRDMEQVAVGQPAKMTVDGVPGRVWQGKVDFIYPELDPKSRTLKARLVFDNPDGLLRPNQFAEVTISGVAQSDVLTVPTTAVIPTPHGARVVRKNPDGTFQPVRVETGQSAGGWTQITAGLSPDDQVVASGQFLIDSESAIQASFDRMTATAHPESDADSTPMPPQHHH